MILLADGAVGDSAFWVGVGTVVGTVVSVLTTAAINLMKAKHEVRKADDETALDEYKKLVRAYDVRVTKLEKRVEVQEAETRQCQRDHQRERVYRIRIMSRMEQYEQMLAQHGIKFSPFDHSEMGSGDGEGERP